MSARTPQRRSCLVVAEEVWGSPLHAARSLDRIGVDALVAVAGEGAAIVGSSRACAAAVDLDPSDPVRFCSDLVAWAEARSPGGHVVPVIPLGDRLVEILDGNRSRFPDRFRLAVAAPEVNEVLLDKVRSLEVAHRAGINVPAWAHVRSADDLGPVADLRLPLIVRPTSWATTGSEYFKFQVLREPGRVDTELRAALDRGAELLVQEYLEVPEDAVELALTWRSADGGRTAVCTGRKRRASARTGGVMAWGEAVDLPDVRAAAERFLDASGHTGPGGLEVIRHDGRLWFVEFNPRLEAIHFLGTAAGIDTVRLTYEDLSGAAPSTVPGQRPASAWIGSAWLNRVRADPAAVREALAARWEFARSDNAVRAVWDPRDPRPGLAVARRILRQFRSRGSATTTGPHP